MVWYNAASVAEKATYLREDEPGKLPGLGESLRYRCRLHDSLRSVDDGIKPHRQCSIHIPHLSGANNRAAHKLGLPKSLRFDGLFFIPIRAVYT
jgi:hypothetical protein